MRWLISLLVVSGLLVAVGCSSGGLPCCMISFDSSAGSGVYCACNGGAGSITETSTSTGCTVSYTINGQTTTQSGMALTACPDAF